MTFTTIAYVSYISHLFHNAPPFVHHLHDPNNSGTNKYRHAENGLCVVARNLIHSPVEPLVSIGIRNIQNLPSRCNLSTRRKICSSSISLSCPYKSILTIVNLNLPSYSRADGEPTCNKGRRQKVFTLHSCYFTASVKLFCNTVSIIVRCTTTWPTWKCSEKQI